MAYSDTEAEVGARYRAVCKIAKERRKAETKNGHAALMARWAIQTAFKRRSARRLAEANPQDEKPIPCSEEIELFDSDCDDAALVSPPRVKRFKCTPKTPWKSHATGKRVWMRPKLKLQKHLFASPDHSQSNDDAYKTQPSDVSSSEDELLDSAFARGDYRSNDEDSEEEVNHSPQHVLDSHLNYEDSEDESDNITLVTCSHCGRKWDGNAQCRCLDSSDESSSSDEDDIHPSDDDDETNKENYFVSQEY